MKETILVTGGTGFIGSHTTVELQNAGYDVVIVDNLSNSRADVIDGIEKITGIRPAFEEVDLRDYDATEAVFKKYPKISGIIHFGGTQNLTPARSAVVIVVSQPRQDEGRQVDFCEFDFVHDCSFCLGGILPSLHKKK